MNGYDALMEARQEFARAIRGCQLLKRDLDAANAKLARLRQNFSQLADWASSNDADNPFAEQVSRYALARLAEWDKPLEQWEP